MPRASAPSVRAIPTRIVILLLLAVVVVVGVAMRDRGDGPGGRAAWSRASDVVVRVVDGDTLVLRSAGTSRLIGVDTPEVFGRRECFGAQASAFAKRLLTPGSRVEVQRDAERRDRYGRSLVYLTLPDGRSFNELLVRQGYALALKVAPNVRHAARFRALADEARDGARGLWSRDACSGRGEG